MKNNSSDVSNPVAKKYVDDAIKNINYVFIGVIVVLTLGFITLLVSVLGIVIDSQRFKAETYQNLVNKVSEQNTKIETLINQINQSDSKDTHQQLLCK